MEKNSYTHCLMLVHALGVLIMPVKAPVFVFQQCLITSTVSTRLPSGYPFICLPPIFKKNPLRTANCHHILWYIWTVIGNCTIFTSYTLKIIFSKTFLHSSLSLVCFSLRVACAKRHLLSWLLGEGISLQDFSFHGGTTFRTSVQLFLTPPSSFPWVIRNATETGESRHCPSLSSLSSLIVVGAAGRFPLPGSRLASFTPEIMTRKLFF